MDDTTGRDSDASAPRGMPTSQWQLCAAIFTECRRLRAFAAELRMNVELEPTTAAHAAIERYVRALDTAVALGDAAAHAITNRE